MRGNKRATIARKLLILRRFCKAAVDAGLRRDNPAVDAASDALVTQARLAV